MLGGEYRHSLDAKNRIFIPAKLRDELGETFVVAKDIRENCLKVYSLSGWEAYIAPLRAQKRSLSEKIMRFLHSSLSQTTPDSQGRIVLPAELVEYAAIEKNVVVVGCGDYAEIWAEDAYERQKIEVDRDELIAELEELGF
jgi:MraZ protein